jgi:hypothetical protein
MKKLPTAFRLPACCCLALLVFLVVAQPTLGLLLALLIPFWFFAGFVQVASTPPILEICKIPAFPALPGFSPRPPPVL